MIQKARAIFVRLLGEIPSEEWDAHVQTACAGDESLRQHVLELLGSHSEPDNLLDHPAPGLAATRDVQAVAEHLDTMIGRYKLLQEIGEGGMGTVYMAEQREPIRREVALKIIKPGMDTRHVIARFEAERQALAMMDHPNIAHVLDAGATESGRPYFVMELVNGIRITDYCDKNHLTTRERLELFVSVFRGIFASLSQQAKHAAGEDFCQLLTALGGGQVGRHGGSSWFRNCDARASPIRLCMPAGGRIGATF
jgi:hypothetical protein